MVPHDPCKDGEKHIYRDEIRAWVRTMLDNLLLATGRAATELIRPDDRQPPPRELFRVQLEECHACVWRAKIAKRAAMIDL